MKFPGWEKGRLGLAALTLCIVLYSSCVAPNNYPVISSLKTEKDWVTPAGRCEVYCIASDADGDSLTYTWSATGGTFSGTGSVTTWVAPPTPCSYTITVMVTDGRGGEATMQLDIAVRVNHPPVIESLIAKPPVVNQAETTAIDCVASDLDGDELSYLWVAARGSISGQGSAVTWTAPNTCGSYVIMVTVADGWGGEAGEKLTITVEKPG